MLNKKDQNHILQKFKIIKKILKNNIQINYFYLQKIKKKKFKSFNFKNKIIFKTKYKNN